MAIGDRHSLILKTLKTMPPDEAAHVTTCRRHFERERPRFPRHLLRLKPSSTSLSRSVGAWEQSETRAETAPLQRDPIANAFEGDRMGVRQQMPACLEPVSRFGITHPITTQAPISVIASFCMETEGF